MSALSYFNYSLFQVRMNLVADTVPAPMCCFRGDFLYVDKEGGNLPGNPGTRELVTDSC